MTAPQVDDVRILGMEELVTPEEVLREHPISDEIAAHVYDARRAAERILHGGDDRLLAIVGPCSIHDPESAMEYGERLLSAQKKFARRLHLIMRVYFEKPRTTIGWKGLINDPMLDGTYQIDKGLRLARKILLDLNRRQICCATEFLDVISPQYYADLIAWGAIGARTTESQCHRELASGLSCPIGFKNGTDGNIKIAADAVRSAGQSHHFLSATKRGRTAISATKGNKSCHIILRGGGGKPNYDESRVDDAVRILSQSGLPCRLMIDFSHANSGKDFRRQKTVAADVCGQIAGDDMRIVGVMIESHLAEGNQEIVQGQPLVYGQSVTDGCIGWEETEEILSQLADAVAARQRNLRDKE